MRFGGRLAAFVGFAVALAACLASSSASTGAAPDPASPEAGFDDCPREFAARAIAGPFPVEWSLIVPTARVLLLRVDEEGPDVVVTVTRGSDSRRVDLPPSGRARQAIVVPSDGSDADRVGLRIEAGGAAQPNGRVVVRHACVDPGERSLVAGFAAIEAAGRLVAAAPEAGPSPRERIAEIDAILAGLGDAGGDRPAPDVLAQLRHARAFLLARGGQPVVAHDVYLEAAAAWEEAGAALEAWIARHRAAQQARRAGRFDLALDELTRLVEDPRVATEATLRAIALNDRCLTLRNLERDDEALACFPAATRGLVAAGDLAEAALTVANHAEVLIGRGRLDEADALLAKARPWAESTASRRVRALYAMAAANLALQRGAIEAALAAYSEGVEHARAHGDRALEASGLMGLGSAYLIAGNLARARELLSAAASRYRAGGYSELLGRSLVRLAEIERRAGDSAAAAAHANAALAERIGASGGESRAPAHLVAAESALDLGRLDTAAAHLAVLAPFLGSTDGRLARRVRLATLKLESLAGADPAAAIEALTAAALRGGDPLGWFDGQILAARNHERAGRLAEAEAAWRGAFERMLAMASTLSLPLVRDQFLASADLAVAGYVETSARRSPGASDGAARLRAVLAWRDARGPMASRRADAGAPGADDRLDRALLRYWIGVANGVPDVAWVGGSSDERAIAELLAQVESASLRRSPRAVPVARTESPAAAVSTPMLVAMDFGTSVFLWRVDERGVRERRVDADSVRALLDELDRRLQPGTLDRVELARLAARLADLLGFDGFLEPEREAWHLVLDGRFASVPPLLLVASRALGRPERNDARWPATRLVRSAPERPDSGRPCCVGRALRVFADPVPPRRAEVAGPLPWPRLPGARREAEAIARLWRPQPVEVRVGETFTREPVLAALREPGAVVHLATHGFVDRGDPARGGLWVASESTPEGYEILGWNRLAGQGAAAALVVLSACDLADGGDLESLGSIGIARLLVDEGVDTVIAALRPVDDRRSIRFQTDLYRALAAGLAPDRALVEAQREALGRGDLSTALAYVAVGR